MKAMILAAGLGTRLGSLTKDRPKALVPFGGKPMLEGLILRLKEQGFDNLLINVHHHAEQIMQFVEEHQGFGVNIRFSHEKEALLDTGGAIAFAKDFFRGNEPVLVHNVDVYSDTDFKQLLSFHNQKQSLATLVVRKRESSRKLLFDQEMKLKGWENLKTGEKKWVANPYNNAVSMAYSGIYIVSPGFAEMLFPGKYSIIDVWLEMAFGSLICGWIDNYSRWYDLGSSDRIENAEKGLFH